MFSFFLWKIIFIEEFTDDTLYDFLENSIASLNESRDEVFKFITIFLLEYGRLLGFYPNINTYTKHSLFDMKSGVFCRIPPLHKHFIEEDDTADFVRLLEARYSNPSEIEYSQQQTNRLLDIVLEFLELHVSDFKHIKSLDILRQIIWRETTIYQTFKSRSPSSNRFKWQNSNSPFLSFFRCMPLPSQYLYILQSAHIPVFVQLRSLNTAYRFSHTSRKLSR